MKKTKRWIWLCGALCAMLFLFGCTEHDTQRTPEPSTHTTQPAVEPTQATTEVTTPVTTEATTEPQPVGVTPLDLVGHWTRTAIENEGYLEKNSNASLEIRGESPEGLYISYTNRQFPEESYSSQTMTLQERELYADCGNDRWVMVVDYVGNHGTQFTLTLTEDGELILQNEFWIEGQPYVSYEFFAKDA